MCKDERTSIESFGQKLLGPRGLAVRYHSSFGMLLASVEYALAKGGNPESIEEGKGEVSMSCM